MKATTKATMTVVRMRNRIEWGFLGILFLRLCLNSFPIHGSSELKRINSDDLFQPFQYTIGSVACGRCHIQEYQSWISTPHAQLTMQSDGFESVDCETCHGPGNHHRRKPVSENILKDPGVSRCLGCHTSLISPRFRKRIAENKLAVHPNSSQLQSLWAHRFQKSLQSQQSVQMQLFILPDCPYGFQATRMLLKWAQEFSPQIELQLTLMNSTEQLPIECISDLERESPDRSSQQKNPSWSIRQQQQLVLIREYYPELFLIYLHARLEIFPEAEENELVRHSDVDWEWIQQCIESGEGLDWLLEDARQSELLGVDASPTLFVDGIEFPGSPLAPALRKAWCTVSNSHSPLCEDPPGCRSDLDCDRPREYCDQPQDTPGRCLPAPNTPLTVTMLDSLDCRSCYSDLLLGSLFQLFPRIDLQWIDIGSRQGRHLANDHDRLPAYFLSRSVEAHPHRFKTLQAVLQHSTEEYQIQPDLLEAPFLWKRKRKEGRLELWFRAGNSSSEIVEAQWAEVISGGNLKQLPTIHYWIENPDSLMSVDYTLKPVPDSDTLLLAPNLNPEQLDLFFRIALWELAPEALPSYLKNPNTFFTPPQFPFTLQQWDGIVRERAPQKIKADQELQNKRPFLGPNNDPNNDLSESTSGGALVHNQLWFPGWSPGTIPRVLYELKLDSQ